MNENINREITQLKSDEVFLIINRVKQKFDFPIHFHPEYELNFILNGKGVRRVVGNSMEEIDDVELVLVGPNLEHGWETHQCNSKRISEITIQFHDGLLTDKLLSLRTFKPIKELFAKSKYGILFSKETALDIMPKILSLSTTDNVQDFIEIITILQQLANSKDKRFLSTNNSMNNEYENSRRMKRVYDFIHKNYHHKISLSEISGLVNMSQSSFNRFIKRRTGKTFIEYTNDTRIGYATKCLLETDLSIGEIAFKCGFNNIANFNRFFKKVNVSTPSKFKNEFKGVRRLNDMKKLC